MDVEEPESSKLQRTFKEDGGGGSYSGAKCWKRRSRISADSNNEWMSPGGSNGGGGGGQDVVDVQVASSTPTNY